MKVIEDIEKIVHQSLRVGNLSKEELLTLLSYIRVYLEVEDRKNNYQILNLYCNWSFHSSLNNKEVQHFINDVQSFFLNDEGIRKINFSNHILKFSELRTDFLSLFKEIKVIPLYFYSDRIWREFSGSLLSIIEERPLVLKPMPIKIGTMEILSLKVVAHAKATQELIDSTIITSQLQDYLRELKKVPPNKAVVVLTLNNNVTAQIDLVL